MHGRKIVESRFNGEVLGALSWLIHEAFHGAEIVQLAGLPRWRLLIQLVVGDNHSEIGGTYHSTLVDGDMHLDRLGVDEVVVS
jgi:hypothetical protein